MTYIDPTGAEITVDEWIKFCRAGGIGFVLQDSWLPTARGDLLIRTCFFGTVFPECDVRPFGTSRSYSPLGVFTQLEQYDTQEDALRGHTRWLMTVSKEEACEVP